MKIIQNWTGGDCMGLDKWFWLNLETNGKAIFVSL